MLAVEWDSMYEVFDSFLRTPTWYTDHPENEKRFFLALREVVDNPQFDHDALGRYIDDKRDRGEEAQAKLTEEAYNKAREYYVWAALIVGDYLEAVRKDVS